MAGPPSNLYERATAGRKHGRLVTHEHRFRPVQAYGLHLQPHLALTWLVLRLLFNTQNLGSADLMNANNLWHVCLFLAI